MNPENFSFVVEGRLAGPARSIAAAAGRPHRAEGQGVRAIVSLTERPLEEETVLRVGFRDRHLPVSGYGAPTIQQIEEFLAFCEAVAEQGAVVVHCFAGQGRTGTTLACALAHEGFGAEEALRVVSTRRGPSIDTLVREQAVFDFAANPGVRRRPSWGAERRQAHAASVTRTG
jgi:hypothetical protein